MPAKATLVAAGALASIAIGAGIGGYVVHGRDVNRDNAVAAASASAAAVQQLQTPVTAGVRSDGSHYGSLFAYLLPIPSGYSPGPDDGIIGDNNYLTGSQVDADIQNNLLDNLPKSDMSSAQGTLGALHIQDLAVRTMVSIDGTAEADFRLLQLDPTKAAADQKSVSDLVDGLGFRQGASVPGYPQATCVLPPGLGSDKVDAMECVGSDGDVEVILEVTGVAPLDQNGMAKLMAQQLNMLKTKQTLTVSSPDQGDQNE